MNKKTDENAISMFDAIDEQEKPVIEGSRIDVVRMEYAGAESMIWEELFDGYNSIKAITFSSGINFMYRLLDMFDTAEVIFGCEDVMSYSVNEIMAYQEKLIEKMRENAGEKKIRLLGRIEDGSVHFYVARGKLSHEKIYLLQSSDGKKRVVMGSANMSFRAFSGTQRENICYVDGDDAYEWYSGVFEELRENSTDEITKKAFELADADENIDHLPISETVRVKRAIAVEPVTDSDDDIRFILDTHNLAKALAPAMPAPEKKTGRVLLSPDKITKIRRDRVTQHDEEEKAKQDYPRLAIDIFEKKVLLNDEPMDLCPGEEEIRKDVKLFLQYMNGFEKFHGETQAMQERYYEFANWFFCSPFMAIMRDLATKYNQQKLPYPVFGLIYGQSKAGKTSFLRTLLKMMIGQMPNISATEFTRTSIEGLKRTVQGAPIIADDLTQQRFSVHAIETIKNDDFGVSEHLTNYPAVVISANEDVKAVAPEVIRRTVICRVSAGLTNTEVMQSNTGRNVQNNIGTAFYREYLRRMMDVMPELVEMLKNDEAETPPDILQYSADILLSLFDEFGEERPGYIRELSLDDYFNEKKTGKFAISAIRNAWKINRGAFVVNKKMNELRYNAGQNYDAARIVKELPETLEAHTSREWIVMNLDEAKDFFELDFKKSWLPWKK